MTRACALFVLGLAIMAVAAASALLSHHNHVLGGALAKSVHVNQDVRTSLAERAQRILARRAELRLAHDRQWFSGTPDSTGPEIED